MAVLCYLSRPTYNTKSQAFFINPSSKGNIYANSFFSRSIKDWNPLPTLDIFKRTVREQILSILLNDSFSLIIFHLPWRDGQPLPSIIIEIEISPAYPIDRNR